MTITEKIRNIKQIEMRNDERMKAWKELEWYKNNIERYKNSKYRMDKEYGNYLERYFDPNEWSVDGKDYNHRMDTSPMPYNIYFQG